jgi:ABC-type uncharacterized transport system substrate-binding protein
MPVVGFLNSQSPDAVAHRVRAFRQGLKETGYVEGENVAIEYRWAEAQFDRLPALAADLVRRQVVVIAAANTPSALAAKAATMTIPIVFSVAEDPVRLGLVADLARPGGNATGINFLSGELVAKRLEFLRELVPGAVRVAVLVNPTGPTAETTLRDVKPAAGAMGLQIQVLNASTSRESMRLSQPSCANGPTPSSLPTTACSPVGGCNLPPWRRVMWFPLHLGRVKLPKPAG